MEEKAVAELDPVLTKTGFTKAVEMIYEDMGIQMAKTLGVEKFGGNVQTSGVKKVGYSYWCTANKDMYRCKVENSLNYIDDTYFDAFSNASLLGKLQNLDKVDRLIKLPNGKGVLFVTKSGAAKNYISCGQYFKSVTSAVISPFISAPVGSGETTSVYPTIPYYQKIVGTDVLIWALEYRGASQWEVKYHSNKSDGETTSCQAIIYGELK